ncbi:MAG: hypothetical protein JW807_08860 [Spirochaetes bacterium]|nr:hypothetical protein [Spirochaetota bacterium]
MKKIIVAAFVIAVCSIVTQACTRDRGWYGYNYDRDGGLRVLWDRHDCTGTSPRYSLIHPREYFNIQEFRRGRDNLYGDRRDWRDEDYSNFYGQDCYYSRQEKHAKSKYRSGSRTRDIDSESVISERYAPPPPAQPDPEYDQ